MYFKLFHCLSSEGSSQRTEDQAAQKVTCIARGRDLSSCRHFRNVHTTRTFEGRVSGTIVAILWGILHMPFDERSWFFPRLATRISACKLLLSLVTVFR